MTSVSTQLYDAIGGRGRFGSFRILVPASWSNEECLLRRNILSKYAHGQAPDFKVDSPHPLYGTEPWTQQYGQCGVSGLNIRLPFPMIVEEPRISVQNRELISSHPSSLVIEIVVSQTYRSEFFTSMHIL